MSFFGSVWFGLVWFDLVYFLTKLVQFSFFIQAYETEKPNQIFLKIF